MSIQNSKDGSLQVGTGTLAYVKSASVTLTANKGEITGLGDLYQSYHQTTIGMTGSAELTFDSTNANTKAFLNNILANSSTSDTGVSLGSKTLKLKLASQTWIRGSVVVDSVSPSQNVNDPTGLSIAFTGNGRLYMSTTGT